LWYPVGCWIDQHLGWSVRRKQIRTVLRDVFLASAVLIAILAGMVYSRAADRAPQKSDLTKAGDSGNNPTTI
jgi:hypothetical protein